MTWRVRRTDQADGSDVVAPITRSTAAAMYDVAMDNAQSEAKQRLVDNPNLNGFKMKFYRDNVGQKGFRIILQTVEGQEVVWYIEEF